MVLTDIGGDPDDQQSLIRLMVYANEFQIEGVIASAAGTVGELKTNVTRPDLIKEIVEGYGKVHAHLLKLSPDFPYAESIPVKSGNANRGRDFIGDKHDTEGSKWIARSILRQDARPLNVVIWGGQTDFAQALWSIRRDKGETGLKQAINQVRVHDINDQDSIVEWMWKEFPGMFYVLSSRYEKQDKREGAYRGMYLGGNEGTTSRKWVDAHVHRGPLGVLYPTRTWTEPNPHGVLKEGDTPSWFYFLPNGLHDPEQPTWGGWGGRFLVMTNSIFRDARDTVDGKTLQRATVYRWRDAFQKDFAARMDWTRGRGNRNPIAVVNGDRSRAVVKLRAVNGKVNLSAQGSLDPDQDELSCKWWIYEEPSSAKGVLTSQSLEAQVQMQTQGDLHVILEVQDKGEPPLTAFRRIVVNY